MEMARGYKNVICETIFREYGGLRCGSKILARKINISYRSVERWFYKETAPKGDQLIDLMAENEAIANQVLKLVEERREQRQARHAMDKNNNRAL